MKALFTTTLSEIKKYHPCEDGWRKILTTLGKTKADDEPLSLLTILDSNGLDDAIWCFEVFSGHDRDFRLFAVWCARQVQHLMTDGRSFNAVEVAEKFANGECDDADLGAAHFSAKAAARDAHAEDRGAYSAVHAAAHAAAWVSGGDVVHAVAQTAAWAAQAAGRSSLETRLRQMIEDGGWVGSTRPEVKQ